MNIFKPDEVGSLDGHNRSNWRDREKSIEKQHNSKSLFQGFVDSAYAYASVLGKYELCPSIESF